LHHHTSNDRLVIDHDDRGAVLIGDHAAPPAEEASVWRKVRPAPTTSGLWLRIPIGRHPGVSEVTVGNCHDPTKAHRRCWVSAFRLADRVVRGTRGAVVMADSFLYRVVIDEGRRSFARGSCRARQAHSQPTGKIGRRSTWRVDRPRPSETAKTTISRVTTAVALGSSRSTCSSWHRFAQIKGLGCVCVTSSPPVQALRAGCPRHLARQVSGGPR
jgi:hypothetical protein